MLEQHKDYIDKMIFGDEINETLPAIARTLDQIVSQKKPIFDEDGLSYDKEFLEEISYGILTLPTDMMSHFVNREIKMLVDNDQLIIEDLKEDVINAENIIKELDDKTIDATAIGNIAYVYENTKNETTKKIAKQWITAYAEQVLIKFSKPN
jgi:hypothetical protein